MNLFARLTTWILSHRRAATIGVVLGVLITGLGIGLLRVDFSVDGFFSSGDDETAYLQGYRERWGGDDRRMVVVIDGQGSTLLTAERLGRIDSLVHALDALPAVKSAAAVTSLPPVGERVAGMFVPKPLLATIPSDSARLDAWRTSLLEDPRFVPTLLSSDGEFGGIQVEVDVDLSDLVAIRQAVASIETLVAEQGERDGLGYHVAGAPAVRAHVLEVMLGDWAVFVPMALTLIALLLFLLFRSVHGVVIPMVAALVPTLMLFGTMGYLGEPLGLLNQVYIYLIPSIAVADAIHLVARFHEEVADARGDLRLSIERTMEHMGLAVLLTSLTTLVGFLSLNTTQMDVLRSFGTYAGIGIVLSYVTVLFLLPLMLWAARHSVHQTAVATDWLSEGLRGTAALALRHRFAVLAITALLTGIGLVFASRVSVDFAVTATYEASHPVTIANQQVDEHLGGLLSLELELVGAPGTFDKAEVLQALWEVEQDFMKDPAVRSTWGISSYLGFVSAAMGGPNAPPATDAVARSVYGFSTRLKGANRLISDDHGRARLMVRTVDLGATDFEVLADRLAAEVTEVLGPQGIEVHATGANLLAYRGLSRVATDLAWSLLTAAWVIGLVIALLFRSLWLGVLSMVPNAIPLVLGYGLLGALGWSLDPAPAVVFSVALGIAVDSTIHVLARYREELALGRDQVEAILASVEHSGRAVTVTAAILIAGIGLNAFSSFPANVTFGVLGGFILTVALVGNLVVLPVLLVVADRRAR